MLSDRRTRLIARLHRRRTREREALVLAEGVRVAREVLDAGAEVRFAVASPRADHPDGAAVLARIEAAGIELERVDDATLGRLADTETPQGLLLVCRQPESSLDARLAAGRLLVLDGVQDPGNAGTLVRSAAAFGLDGVVALDGTVDPWNPKAVRASAGTAFRLPLLTVSWQELQGSLKEAGSRLWLADAGGEPPPAHGPGAPWALVVGSEARGARDGVRAEAHRTLAVPMPGGTESLNAGVAGAILMYALTRTGDER